MTITTCTVSIFLSTLSLRRATNDAINGCNPDFISIHALLAESDEPATARNNKNNIFLSTLSLRRATSEKSTPEDAKRYFYPRSPCGERQGAHRLAHAPPKISIHALLAESDERAERHANSQQEFLSTLSLRRATDVNNPVLAVTSISIHALLAESDCIMTITTCTV